MWCAARHCAFESHPLRQKTASAFAGAVLFCCEGRRERRRKFGEKTSYKIMYKDKGTRGTRLQLLHPSLFLSAIQIQK